jgi:hypothetical protein
METKRREIRIDEDLWNAAKTQAHSEGVGVSELVRNWLEDYVADAAPVHTELSRIIRRLAKIHKRLHTDRLHPGGFVWPNT